MSRDDVQPGESGDSRPAPESKSVQADSKSVRGGGFVLRMAFLLAKGFLGVAALCVVFWQLIGYLGGVSVEVLVLASVGEVKVLILLWLASGE